MTLFPVSCLSHKTGCKLLRGPLGLEDLTSCGKIDHTIFSGVVADIYT